MELSEAKRESIVNKLQKDIDSADDYYYKEIEPLVTERYAVVNADVDYYQKKYPRLSKRCDIVSTDVQDTIESTMPALMKTFFGSTDIVTVQGMDGTTMDEDRAEKMQALINYQLERSHFFTTFYRWAKDALITNLGIIKVDWERTYKEQQQRIQLAPDKYEAFVADAQMKGVEILGVEVDPVTGGVIVDYVAKVIDKNQPRIMNILASEFRFSPDASTLEDAEFVAHRKSPRLTISGNRQSPGFMTRMPWRNLRETVPLQNTRILRRKSMRMWMTTPTRKTPGERRSLSMSATRQSI